MEDVEIVYRLENALVAEGIEYFGWVDFANCRVINERLYSRHFADDAPKAVLSFLVPYYTGDSDDRNVSLYAVSRDYHIYFRELFERLKPLHGGRAVGFADHSPIDEREAAVMAGLGDLGDNGLLINEKYGSFVFIGELLCDFAPEEIPPPHVDSGCIHCGKCRRECPSPDACLSELTQKKGDLDDSTASLMRKCRTAWGCDICQLVCPLNTLKAQTPIEFFREGIYHNAAKALEADDPDRAYYWRGKAVIERNIEILNNTYKNQQDERRIKRQAWIYRTK